MKNEMIKNSLDSQINNIKQNKAFTIIELLAVIVILAIIFLITLPIVLNIIETVSLNAFRETNQNIVRDLERRCMLGHDNSINYITEGKVGGLIFSGTMPDDGVIILNKNCSSKLVSNNKNFCAKKNETQKTIAVTKLQKGNCSLLEDDSFLPAYEVNKRIGIGWNLSNSLDSYILNPSSNLNISDYEEYWSNPITTKSMIDKIKESGFTSLRIPITWYQHIDENNIIDIDWLNRVKEVVDYGIDNNMYVIIDTHHEHWLDLDLQLPYIEIEKKITTIWEQIATYFKDYDGKLIFELMNEPRDIDGDKEWTGTADMNKLVYMLSKASLEKIRSISGNEKRTVLLTTYAGKPILDFMKEISKLDDGYTILSLHSYDPYSFTRSNDATFNNDVVNSFYNNLIKPIVQFKNFSSMPIILTEFGNYQKENYTDWKLYIDLYITETQKINTPVLLWDTGKSETYGLFDRKNLNWYDERKINDIFSVYNLKIAKSDYINKMEAINNTTSYRTSGFNASSISNIQYGVKNIENRNHYFVSSNDNYVNSSSSSFRFDEIFNVNSEDGYFLFNLKFKTNSKRIYYYARLYFYDNNNVELYSDDTYSNRIIYSDNNNNYDEQIHTKLYYVPGAKKVKLERIANSSSNQGNGAFDIEIYDISLTDGTKK